MKKSGLVFLAIFLICLVSCHLADERGLLHVRHNDNRLAYTQTESDPTIVWPHVPLYYLVEGGDHRTVDRAVSEWNHRVGVDLFEPAIVSNQVDVVVVMNEPHPPVDISTPDIGEPMDAAASAHHYYDSQGNLKCVIWLGYQPTNRLEYIVLMHELGHALGLAHDGHDDSIMREYVKDDTEVSWNAKINTNPMSIQTTWITDHDKRLLRSLYLISR